MLCSGGWDPRVHLHSQSGTRPVYDAGLACFVSGGSVQAERRAGTCNSQACYSSNLGRAIALAVLDDGRRRIGERIQITAVGRRAPPSYPARVSSIPAGSG